jgi:hypothetical protein
MKSLIRKRYPTETLEKIINDDYYAAAGWIKIYETIISNYDGTCANDLIRAGNCLDMAIKSNFYHILYNHCR